MILGHRKSIKTLRVIALLKLYENFNDTAEFFISGNINYAHELFHRYVTSAPLLSRSLGSLFELSSHLLHTSSDLTILVFQTDFMCSSLGPIFKCEDLSIFSILFLCIIIDELLMDLCSDSK